MPKAEVDEAMGKLADAGIDIDDVTDKLLHDGVDLFVVALDKLLAGVESKREAVVTGKPERIESVIPDELEPAIADRVRKAAQEDVARRVWKKDETLWGGPGPGDRRPARLADDLGPRAGGRGRPARVRGRLSRRRPDRRRAARHGRFEPRAGGLPAELWRFRGRHAAARARHDRPGGDPRHRARGRPVEDALRRVEQVRRHDRDPVPVRLFPRPRPRRGGGRRGRQALRGRHRPGHRARRPGERARLPAHVRERPGDRRPRRCRTSGSCRRR
jgi:hypothetical protein